MSSPKIVPFLSYLLLFLAAFAEQTNSQAFAGSVSSSRSQISLSEWPGHEPDAKQKLAHLSTNGKMAFEASALAPSTTEPEPSSAQSLEQPQNLISESSGLSQSHQTRLLQQSIQTNNKFISGSTIVFQSLFAISRNLLLVGILTNSIDLFLPLLVLGESFLMLGFWACSKHYLTHIYSSVFSSYWDVMNIIRLVAHSSSDIPQLTLLSQYGLSDIAIINLSGELTIALLLLIFTIFSKVTIICTQYECLRKMAASIRSIWNGYFFVIFPRVATFTGLHWRGLGLGSNYDALNAITCSLLSIAMIAYFVLLLIQTRRINPKCANAEECGRQLGLVSRIDFKREFNFDCLQFSLLYYPSMNYVRLFVYFLPIGLFWDCQQLSYGGPIAAQFVMLMIEISSTGYLELRDKILFPIHSFLLMLVQIALIVIGLAESVPYSSISESIEVLTCVLLILLFGSSFVVTARDTWQQLKIRCNNKIGQISSRSKKNDTTHHFAQGSTENKKSEQDEEAEESKEIDDKVLDFPSSSHKNTEKLTKLKLKRARADNKPKTALMFN